MEIILWVFLLGTIPFWGPIFLFLSWLFIGWMVVSLFETAYKLNNPTSYGWFHESNNHPMTGVVLWPIFAVAFLVQMIGVVFFMGKWKK